jgi:3-phosphoshikimate 1-carboxyvinyltransferase
MLRISKPLTLMGAHILTHDGKPPIDIKGGQKLKAINYVMPEASAQVKSCIVLAGLYAEGSTVISETGISRDHTERMLKTFSYPIRCLDKTIEIDAIGECQGTQVSVPGDISSAAFFIVAATIIPNSDVLIRNVGVNPTRIGIIHILSEMGADITLLKHRQYGEEPVADIHIKYAPLRGITINQAMVPLAIDEFPIIFIAAACAKGETTLHGAQELRMKESDRIGAMVDGLQQLSIDAKGYDDGICIKGGEFEGGVVNSRGDHRIAMSFAIAGAVAKKSITINDCANIATSFPNFKALATALHFQIEEVINNV